jgi:hypothetical protein
MQLQIDKFVKDVFIEVLAHWNLRNALTKMTTQKDFRLEGVNLLLLA